MASLSISALCKKNGISVTEAIDWLISEYYITGYKNVTERGLRHGISIATGNDGGRWLVYNEKMQALIKKAVGVQNTESVQYTLTDLSKKIGITRTTLVEWFTQECYILTANAITSKGEEIGLFTKQTPYNTIIYGSEKTVQFLSEASKNGQITLKAKDKQKSHTPQSQNLTELPPDSFIILDTETTGFSNKDEVVELGILSGSGEELYNSLFCPTVPMRDSATEVTGITNEMLKTAPKFKDEWPKILELIKEKILSGHNVRFDKRLLQATINRYGLNYNLEENHEFIDTMAFAKQELPGEDSYKLQNLCQSLNIKRIQSHRAVDDCKMTWQMVQALTERKVNTQTI